MKLQLRELSLMYRSSDGVVTIGLPDRAFEATDLVAVKCFRGPAFCPVMIWSWESLFT